mmetsp:Transcript_37397/g.112062  ORF Transcript_37397/g.112062 Transcript_37397/m.112062 type:complete len:344 (-) Transcript_37397:588-1619(-)
MCDLIVLGVGGGATEGRQRMGELGLGLPVVLQGLPIVFVAVAVNGHIPVFVDGRLPPRRGGARDPQLQYQHLSPAILLLLDDLGHLAAVHPPNVLAIDAQDDGSRGDELPEGMGGGGERHRREGLDRDGSWAKGEGGVLEVKAEWGRGGVESRGDGRAIDVRLAGVVLAAVSTVVFIVVFASSRPAEGSVFVVDGGTLDRSTPVKREQVLINLTIFTANVASFRSSPDLARVDVDVDYHDSPLSRGRPRAGWRARRTAVVPSAAGTRVSVAFLEGTVQFAPSARSPRGEQDRLRWPLLLLGIGIFLVVVVVVVVVVLIFVRGLRLGRLLSRRRQGRRRLLLLQ